MAVNGTAPGVIGRACQDRGIRCVHLSTDYVLDAPEVDWLTEDLAPNPRSTYARTKLVGERAALDADAVVVRLQWVYQPGLPGFYTRALQAMARGESVSLVTDQVGSPTTAGAIAPALIAAARGQARGLFHLACAGESTAYEWIARGAQIAGVALRAQKVSRAELGGAPRPARSCLQSTRFEAAFGVEMPHWEAAQSAAMVGWYPAG
jgi:dTDP-4-dehydrorhamnose reductase